MVYIFLGLKTGERKAKFLSEKLFLHKWTYTYILVSALNKVHRGAFGCFAKQRPAWP